MSLPKMRLLFNTPCVLLRGGMNLDNMNAFNFGNLINEYLYIISNENLKSLNTEKKRGGTG